MSVFLFLKPNGITQWLIILIFFMCGKKLYTGAFSPNCFIIFYLKYPFHLVLKVRKGSNFHHIFIWVSGRFPSPWIFTSTHRDDLGTLKAMGSLQRLSSPSNCIYLRETALSIFSLSEAPHNIGLVHCR